MDKIIEKYIRHLKLERNYSKNTIDAYRHDLGYLLNFCNDEGCSPQALELEDLQRFALSIHEHGVGAATQARILSGVRSFYRFLLIDGFIDNDPSELLESPQMGEHLPEVLTTQEVDSLEESIDLRPGRALAHHPGQGQQGAARSYFRKGNKGIAVVVLRP